MSVAVRCPSWCWTSFTPAPEEIISDAAVVPDVVNASLGGTRPTTVASGVKIGRFQFVTRSGPLAASGKAKPERGIEPRYAPRIRYRNPGRAMLPAARVFGVPLVA
ncbi:MAG TPA: hypothetical protein VFI35_11095 [Actinomycetota bacterium]|nr:hypothetical protein [Actinomycetota bacterium]